MRQRVAAGELRRPVPARRRPVGGAGLRRDRHARGLRDRPRRGSSATTARPTPTTTTRRSARPGCGRRSTTCSPAARSPGRSTSPAGCSIKWRVELLWWEGCPSHGGPPNCCEDTLAELGRGDVHVVRREVRTRDEARASSASPARRPSRSAAATSSRPTRPPPSPAASTSATTGAARRCPTPPTSPSACATSLARPWDLPRWVDIPPPAPLRPPTRSRSRMASITFDGITKRYPDGTLAVDDLDLDIRDGEFLVLVGPSGCGKTTALRMAAGLEEISGGRLLIGDRVVNDVRPGRARHRDGLPELRALPAHDGAGEHRLPAACRRHVEGGDRRTRVDAGRGVARAHRVPAPQAEGALRRPAAAGRHGPGDRPQAAGVPDGRAAVQPRRQAARPDARRDPRRCSASTGRRRSTSPTTRSRP